MSKNSEQKNFKNLQFGQKSLCELRAKEGWFLKRLAPVRRRS
jgi:hypothetical protein